MISLNPIFYGNNKELIMFIIIEFIMLSFFFTDYLAYSADINHIISKTLHTIK